MVRERAYLLWEQAGRRMDAPTTPGIKRSINASANAPTPCESERVVRKARRTSTGFGRAPLRRANSSSVTKIERLDGADRRRLSWPASVEFLCVLNTAFRSSFGAQGMLTKLRR